MRSLLFAAIVGLVLTGQAKGQGTDAGSDPPVEQIVRELDRAEADAVLRGDYTLLDELWSPDYTVNNPRNNVAKAGGGPIRTGARIYSSFVREIESVQIHGATAIVMGRETVVPKGIAPDAGVTIHRRYTNIWIKGGEKWLLTARHANVICPESRQQR